MYSMHRGIWGQSLLIDKDSRVDIRVTYYNKISKLVPKERIRKELRIPRLLSDSRMNSLMLNHLSV